MLRRSIYAIAVIMAICIVLLGIWAASGSGATSKSARNEAENAVPTSEKPGTSEGDHRESYSAPDEEWPGQSLGYVGSNGEGTISSDDYATDEEYSAALIGAGEPEVEIERIPVPFDETGESGYMRGFLSISFFADCGEQRAREIIADLGGIWVSDTFAWKSTQDLGYSSVSAYFPDAPYEDDLCEIIDHLNSFPEVKQTILSGWAKSLA